MLVQFLYYTTITTSTELYDIQFFDCSLADHFYVFLVFVHLFVEFLQTL